MRIKKFSILIFSLLLLSCVHTNNNIPKNNKYKLSNKTIKFDKNHKIKLNKYINGKPTIVENNDNLFIISVSTNIIKISKNNKKIEWIKKINTIPQNNFVFDDNYIYFIGINNNFYILNYNTGNIEYIFINSNIKTIFNIKKPILYNNLVIVFFYDNRIIIFNKNNKKILFDKEYKEINEEINNNLLKINNNETIDLNKIK